MKSKNALVLFAYRRPEMTLNQVRRLGNCDAYTLVVILDYSDTAEYKLMSKKLRLNTSIHLILRKRNFGLKKSIEDGIDIVSRIYTNLCVVEDDMIVNHIDVCQILERIDLTDCFEVSGFPMAGGIESALPLGSSWFWGMKSESWLAYRKYQFKGIRFRNTLRFDFDFSYPFLFMLAGQIRGTVNSWAIYKHLYMQEQKLECEYIKTGFMFMENPLNGTNSDDLVDVSMLGDDWRKNLLLLSKSTFKIKNTIKWLVGFIYLLRRGYITG